MNLKTFTVKKGFRFYNMKAKRAIGKGVGAGDTIELDTDGEEYKAQSFKLAPLEAEEDEDDDDPDKGEDDGEEGADNADNGDDGEEESEEETPEADPSNSGNAKGKKVLRIPVKGKAKNGEFPTTTEGFDFPEADVDFVNAWAVSLGVIPEDGATVEEIGVEIAKALG